MQEHTHLLQKATEQMPATQSVSGLVSVGGLRRMSDEEKSNYYLRCSDSYFKNGLCYCGISDQLIGPGCICLEQFFMADMKTHVPEWGKE